MARNVRLRELLIGVEGLALLRGLHDGSEEAADARLAEVRRLLADDGLALAEPVHEASPRSGYGAWAETYDEPGNPIIALEEPAVWALLDEPAPGRALDAACGTGRHARRLVALGHDVVGIDLAPAMLARAAANVPEASFGEADLRDIPAPDGSFDLVVCALALAHVAELGPAASELARVMRSAALLVVSVLHPLQAQLGWQARFAAAGQRAFVREHPHTHADYLAAFRPAGLALRDCIEVRLTVSQVRSLRRAFAHIPEATVAAYAGLPAVLILGLEKG